MIITTSNILPDITPANITVVTGASTDDPVNVVDPDFSTNYTSSDQFRLTIDFGITQPISYVAVAGINIASSGSAGNDRTRVYDGDELITTTHITRNHCTVMTFESRTFTNLRVGLFNKLGTTNPRLTFCAAGDYLTVPNGGEQAGYVRPALIRSYKNKSTLNDQAAPVAVLRKKTVAKVNLKIPNASKLYSEDDWQSFLDFSESNYFFIREQETTDSTSEFSGTNNSAYLCFDAMKNRVSAHAQTRELYALSLGFSVFNGL